MEKHKKFLLAIITVFLLAGTLTMPVSTEAATKTRLEKDNKALQKQIAE